jgi:hypothetical protein
MTPDLRAAAWFKSTRSANDGGCVEVAFVERVVAVRDSKDPAGPVLIFPAGQWAAFVAAVRQGQHDGS